MNEPRESTAASAPPVFAKRKGPSKRRVRGTTQTVQVPIQNVPSESKQTHEPALNTEQTTTNVLTSQNHLSQMRVVKRPRASRRRIRAQGEVPGYTGPFSMDYDEAEAKEAKIETATDYSAEGLRKLRLQSLSQAPTPAQKGANSESHEMVSPPTDASAIPVPDLPPPPAPSKQHSQKPPPQNRTTKPVPTARADPFSAEWRGEQHDTRFDTAFVSDMMDTEETSFIPLSARETQHASIDPTEEDDLAWEERQLRRAGHETRVQTADEEDSAEKMRWGREIIRDEEETVASVGAKMRAVKRCGEFLAEATLESDAKLKLAAEKIQRAKDAEKKALQKVASAEVEIERDTERLQFYEEITNVVQIMSDELNVAWTSAVIRRKDVLGALHEKALQTAKEMEASVDEFGRFRPAVFDRSPTPSPPASPGIRGDSGADEAGATVEKIIERFSAWKRKLPGEYAASKADIALGRLVGLWHFVHEGEEDRQLEWVSRLPEESRAAALLSSRTSEILAAEVAARWQPRSDASCDKFGGRAKRVLDCLIGGGFDMDGKQQVERIGKAFEERLLLETRSVLESKGDFGESSGMVLESVLRCVVGGRRVAKVLKRDVGVQSAVMMGKRYWSGLDGESRDKHREVYERLEKEDSEGDAAEIVGSSGQ